MSKTPKFGGGLHAATYVLKMARKSGNFKEFYKILKSKNTCKTCALGMQGMKNEIGESFQVCKKALQAVAHDLLKGINPEIFGSNTIHDFKNMRGREIEALGRIVEPLYLEEGSENFKPISWEQAYDIVIEQLTKVDKERMFFYTSGRSSNEAAFTIQLLARQLGTNNISNCSYYCHQASGVSLKQAIGSGTATVMLKDLEKTDLVVLIGANPSSNHPRFITHMVDIRKRGGKAVIINPFKEVGLQKFRIPSRPTSLFMGRNSTVSDLYLQPHCGGDMAFLKAVCAYLWQEKRVSSEFIDAYCNNVDEFKADLEVTDVDKLLEMSGISKVEMFAFTDYLKNSKNIIFSWAMGLTHQKWGVETIRMLTNLALLLGQIGGEGRGLLPLRGHSNVQGVGTMGVVPKLAPKVVEALTTHLNVKIPTIEGHDTYECMQLANKGEIDLALMLGGNLYGANPDLNWAAESLQNINFNIYISTTLNLGHFYGKGKNTLILPVRSRSEEKQSTTQESMFSYVRLSDGGFDAPADNIPSEVELFATIGKRIFNDDIVPWTDFSDHHLIREFIAKVIPGMKYISKIDDGRQTFTIDGRIYHKPEFNTENSKANLFIGEPVDPRPKDGYFNLTTFRSEGQFNTIIYEEEDKYRGLKSRDIIYMNKYDINRSKLSVGSLIKVKSTCGELNVTIVEGQIREGNVAMYYPEANVLVPQILDPQSKTPAFKRIEVKIELA